MIIIIIIIKCFIWYICIHNSFDVSFDTWYMVKTPLKAAQRLQVVVQVCTESDPKSEWWLFNSSLKVRIIRWRLLGYTFDVGGILKKKNLGWMYERNSHTALGAH